MLCLEDIQFLCQTHSNLNTFDKSRLFVIHAEGTNSVDDLIDFLQGLPVHQLIKILKVGFDGCVIEAAGFVIGIEQHLQDALGIVGIVWLLVGQMGLESSHMIAKHYAEQYEESGYFAAVNKATLFSFAIDGKETGNFTL